jgi:N utilization substance protein B
VKPATAATPSARNRHRARLRALQALYQHHFNPLSSSSLVEQFMNTQDMSDTDLEYFQELLRQVIHREDELNGVLAEYLDIPFDRLDATERCILAIAVYELTDRPELPVRVVLNEAVSLAKKFGATESHKFINGVLDKAAKALRV